MPIRRSKFYVGAGGSCRSEDLNKMDTGEYVAEPKWDGMFASLQVGLVRHAIRSRDTVDGRIIDDERSGDIAFMELPSPGTVVIGELEAATEKATEAVLKRGYRKMYLYDILADGDFGGCAGMPWESRRAMLEDWHGRLSSHVKEQLELTPYRRQGFKAFYDEVVAGGGEGLVLKQRYSTAVPTRMDGKIDTWLKVKAESTYDYVLIGEELTPKLKQKTGVLGLWDESKKGFKKCLICGVPESLLKPENYGKTVVEVVAFQRFKSGSARSARFVRVRTDREAMSVVAEQVG